MAELIELVANRGPATKDREKVCDVCGFRVTVGTDGTEYGHRKRGNPCPRRSDEVEPTRPPAE